MPAKDTRVRSDTRPPTALTMRRIWRLRPSWIARRNRDFFSPSVRASSIRAGASCRRRDHAVGQPFKLLGAEFAPHPHEVDLLHAVAGVGELVGQFPVVGEQQPAGSLSSLPTG